jgi:hypothetical protein
MFLGRSKVACTRLMEMRRKVEFCSQAVEMDDWGWEVGGRGKGEGRGCSNWKRFAMVRTVLFLDAED